MFYLFKLCTPTTLCDPEIFCCQLVNEQQESRPLLSPSIDDFLCEAKPEAVVRPVTSNTAGNQNSVPSLTREK